MLISNGVMKRLNLAFSDSGKVDEAMNIYKFSYYLWHTLRLGFVLFLLSSLKQSMMN